MRTDQPELAVDAIIERAGPRIACGTPLGIGKPVPLLNALYARVKADSRLRLSIFTALSLEIPRGSGELERRFLEPYVKRVFAGVPELDYMRDIRGGGLPSNVEVTEFYFRAGAMLDVAASQQSYVSSNYTHAARDMLARGVNAVLVMVAERSGRYSLSSNPDLTLDVVQALRARGSPCVVAAFVNRNLPFMAGAAEVDADFFDVILDAPALEHPLFAVPNPPVDLADHAIGIQAAALVKDGGTLQLGIGSLGDAVAHALGRRHVFPAAFAAVCGALGIDRQRSLVEREGGLGEFAEGLYASSEMFNWGLMTLIRAGVIRRRADVDSGPILEGAFFLGPNDFYRALREMTEDERHLIRMAPVSHINDLYGEERRARRQRRDARFINACMKATLFGAAASDGLDDGRVVSGVGGQYNFVAMAHELDGARSILLARATREGAHGSESNIVFNYGETTIPRHLRDIVVTEYGIADLRGRTDAEVAAAMIRIADARFQESLAAAARRAGKLPRDYRIPDDARDNTPAGLARRLSSFADAGMFPLFPLGTDFDPTEQRLVAALRWLKANSSGWRRRLALATGVIRPARVVDDDASALARMDLETPRKIRERLLRRLVLLALRRTR